MSSVRQIACPACGGTLGLRASGWSVTLACQHCASILDVSRPEVQLIERHEHAVSAFTLPLGARGQFFGTEWEVAGAVERSDGSDDWHEYLLFNPYVGYRWLVEWQGEWQFGTMLLDRPTVSAASVTWRDQRFTRDDSGQAVETKAVVGEFYWRITTGDTARCLTYTRRDVTLSREEVEGEVNWTQLVPVRATDIEPFIPTAKRPRRKAPKASRFHEPVENKRNDIAAMCGVALLTIIAGWLLMLAIAGSSAIVKADIKAPFGRTAEGIRLGTVTVTHPRQFVRISARAASLDNQWIDLDYSFVDRATGQSLDAYGLAERYRGRDWTEGDKKASTTFGQIPRGTYDIYVDAAAHSWPTDYAPDRASYIDAWGQVRSTGWSTGAPDPVPVALVVKTNTISWGNFWTFCILVIGMLTASIYFYERDR